MNYHGHPIVSHFRQVASEEPPPPASSIHYIPELLLASDVVWLWMAPSSPSTTTISGTGSEIDVNPILSRWRRDAANLVLKHLFSLVSSSTIMTTNSAASPPPFNSPPPLIKATAVTRHITSLPPPPPSTISNGTSPFPSWPPSTNLPPPPPPPWSLYKWSK